ncbi:MAG TPA: ribonuclease PH [Actinomycetota bacterium]|nr:ribonuclease PH [Actinomycetota bacterium]
MTRAETRAETRADGRRPDELRPITVVRGYSSFAEGSALYCAGRTRVLVTASVEERVPDFLRGTGKGWVTAEYSMLPRATETRTPREAAKGRQSGRTQEIQRLIGRSLRSVCTLPALGERTVWLDCDVLQADGGTRTASISAAYLALADAVAGLIAKGRIPASPLREEVAAVSVGIVGGVPSLDLAYTEDSTAQVDLNLVMTASGGFVELQGTAEGLPFTADELAAMISLGRKGIGEIVAVQREVLARPPSGD